jgi:hypothetical protein
LIKREKGQSLLLRQLIALKGRISSTHPLYEQIEIDLGKKRSGDYGENSIDYYLSQVNDDNIKFKVLKDIRLPFKDFHFQIDILLLFPSYYVVLEVKHLTGTLLFDPDFQQLIQIKNKVVINADNKPDVIEEKISRKDPILQVKMQYNQLNVWMKQNGIIDYQGNCMVVLSNPNAIFKAISNPKMVQEFVVRSVGLPFRMEKLIRKHKNTAMKEYDTDKIAAVINNNNIPKDRDILKEYGIHPSEILTGVRCPKCHELAMVRLIRRWECSSCGHTSRNAHIQTLIDYSILLGNSITVKEACRFLHIKNSRIARDILKSLGLHQKGISSAAIYCLKILLNPK